MGLVCPESQSVNRVDISKAVWPSWFYVPVIVVVGVILFKDWSLPWRVRSQDNLEGVHVISRSK